MKRLLIASLLSAQLISTPAVAASLDEPRVVNARTGSFLGARFRIPLGGEQSGKPRLGLTAAATTHSALSGGSVRLRYSEGVELGFAEGRPLSLSIAGRPLVQQKLGLQDDDSDDDDGGISTGWIIAGGVVLALGIGAAVFLDKLDDASE